MRVDRHQSAVPDPSGAHGAEIPRSYRPRATMCAAMQQSPDVIAGPTINAARLNELCRSQPSLLHLIGSSPRCCSACVDLAGAWGGTADMALSSPCVCTLPGLHSVSTGSGGRLPCSVGSAGVRQVKQCLESVLVAFEVAGYCPPYFPFSDAFLLPLSQAVLDHCSRCAHYVCFVACRRNGKKLFSFQRSG
jgi:hypothetical protein